MHEIISEAIKKSTSLNEVKDTLLKVLRKTKEKNTTRIGYVSGIITSEGPDRIIHNIQRLQSFTNKIRNQYDFPIFSPTDVFNNEVYERIKADQIPQRDWHIFWQEILGAPDLITDIFMTPRWEVSSGSIDEHQTAQKAGLNIVYITKELD